MSKDNKPVKAKKSTRKLAETKSESETKSNKIEENLPESRDPYLQEMGRKFVKIRKEKNVTQLQLAAKAKVGVIAVTSLENARSSPNLITLRKMANALKCNVIDFLPGHDFEDRFFEGEAADIES
jgi:DNA-binding XRE family transcriptional regulator